MYSPIIPRHINCTPPKKETNTKMDVNPGMEVFKNKRSNIMNKK